MTQLAGRGFGLARALSKLGFCSRAQAWKLIETGRVRVNGSFRRDPEWRTNPEQDQIEVDGAAVSRTTRVYLMLNKPRGLVTTMADEQGRPTVYQCFAGEKLPFVAPAGRLDKASEGLLLFSNDTVWTARITAPDTQLDKTYHVQIDCVPDETLVKKLGAGISSDGDWLAAKAVKMLRTGQRNSWLEIVLDEGKNRHIRRLLEGFNILVLRLVRVAIGNL